MYGSNHPNLAFPKSRAKVLDKRDAKRQQEAAWRRVRAEVRQRDGGKCRCCGKPGYDVHHLIYRSQGGVSDANTLIYLCRACHQDAHAKLLRITWSGKCPAKSVRFARVGAK